VLKGPMLATIRMMGVIIRKRRRRSKAAAMIEM